ncbi:hypothetical protein [Geobacillus sp. YF-1]|uniref:hypothetical protein n=1 Tax=Geobacillus sp. YF-1 TaxID=3457480 RepID=UPI0040458074
MRIADFLKRSLCKWQPFDYDETKDPEMIEGFIVFEDVTYFETDCVKDFDVDEILEVVLISATPSLEKVKIVTDGVNIIMIEAGSVEWHSL